MTFGHRMLCFEHRKIKLNYWRIKETASLRWDTYKSALPMLNICQMSPEAQTLAGFADLGDVVSFVHDFISLHPAPHKDFQLVRKNTSSSSESRSAWHPSNPEDEARHACTYPTWHIPWLWNKLQETSLQGGQSMAHSIALWNINMLLIRSCYLMMLYDISWYWIIIFEMFVLKILFPWMCFRTCLKVPRPFGLSLNKQFPTNIKHLGSASGKRTSTMSAKGVTAETWDCVPVLGMPLGSLSTIAKHQNVCHLTYENQDLKRRNGLKHTCSNILCSHDT